MKSLRMIAHHHDTGSKLHDIINETYKTIDALYLNEYEEDHGGDVVKK